MDISDLIIDKEFESVIPPLDEQEFEFLEESILHDGEVYHPLVVWNNIIVDGHHRYKILKNHPDIKYRIAERCFENRYEAISWICLNQLGRRNITSIQKTILIGKKYNAEKASHGNQDRFEESQNEDSNPPRRKNCVLEDRRNATANKIASEVGVSSRTVQYAGDFVDGMDAAEEVLPGVSKDISSGRIKPKQSDVRAIAKAPTEERKQMAENLYKELTPEEKERKKKKRDLSKSIQILDETHMPSKNNKIKPEDMLLTFQSEVEKVISSMDFCFDYSPELLTEAKYLSEVKETIKQLKDYIKDLEENRYANII